MVWIKGCEGKYKISNDGKIFSVRLNRYLSFENIRGYKRVSLRANGKTRHFFVHRLVAEAYIENTNSRPFINHINGIKDDNRAENLEWVTQKENIRHSWDTGLSKSSDNQKEAARRNQKKAVEKIKVLDDNIVSKIFDGRNKGLTMRKIAYDLGISPATVNNVLKGYKYVS